MFKRVFICTFIALQSACASKLISKIIPEEEKKVDKVAKVKTVAIVAYDTLEFIPSGLASQIIPIIGTAQAANNKNAVESELSLQLYNDLAAELASEKFTVISFSRIRSNDYYKKLESKMSNVASNLAMNEFQRPTVVKGIVRPLNPKYQFTAEEKKQLMQSLGVDAIIFARINFLTESDSNLFGLGKSYLAPIFSFYMYGGDHAELIWFASQFAGPRSTKSLGRVSGLEDKNVIAQESRSLAKKAMKEFLEKTKFN